MVARFNTIASLPQLQSARCRFHVHVMRCPIGRWGSSCYLARMLRPPRSSASAKSDKLLDALDYEIAQETAGTLGRLGRALERALRILSEFDIAWPSGTTMTVQARDERQKLVGEASRALWHFVVQREACGLRDGRQVLRDYAVPPEVRDRMGMFV
jgi:hypothetical protein